MSIKKIIEKFEADIANTQPYSEYLEYHISDIQEIVNELRSLIGSNEN